MAASALANPSSSMRHVARVVERDAGITGRLLRSVNNAFFAPAQRNGRLLGNILLEKGFITREAIAHALARHGGGIALHQADGGQGLLVEVRLPLAPVVTP